VALIHAGIPFTLRPYEHRDDAASFGAEAAAALAVDPRRIFKTLIVEVAGELVVAVVPVAQMLDLKALAAAVGAKKAALADPSAAGKSSGYVLGGISPIGQRTPLRTVIGRLALRYELIMVSAGKRGLQVELAPSDLIALTQASTAPIAH